MSLERLQTPFLSATPSKQDSVPLAAISWKASSNMSSAKAMDTKESKKRIAYTPDLGCSGGRLRPICRHEAGMSRSNRVAGIYRTQPADMPQTTSKRRRISAQRQSGEKRSLRGNSAS